MNNLRPQTLLLILLGAVPLIVAGAVLISLLLTRAGFGLLVGVGVPFLVAMVSIAALGLVLGRAATRRPGSEEGPPERRGRSRSRDGV